MNKILLILLFFLSTVTFAKGNVEISGTYVKDNKNYIYLESEDTKYKLIKKELTKEGVAQILKNKETELTLFVPKKSIKYQRAKKQKEDLE